MTAFLPFFPRTCKISQLDLFWRKIILHQGRKYAVPGQTNND
jgi:hypothetical protein